SDSCGTLISMTGIYDSPGERASGGVAVGFPGARPRGAERRRQQFLLLRVVLVVVADGGRGGGGASGVAELLRVLHRFGDLVLHVEPGALVLRFVLAPDDLRRRRVLLHLGFEGLVRERIDLLEAHE